MKILYTASVLSHICQFHLPMMKMFKSEGHEINVAARDNLKEKNGLKLNYCDKFFDIPFQRSPTNLKNLSAYKLLRKIISKNNYDLIICNTPMCGILTRLAAKKKRRNGLKIVYIAHGFHFYKGSGIKTIPYYLIEKIFANHFTDLLICINNEDYNLAKEKFSCCVGRIHGVGVNPERYKPYKLEEKHLAKSRLGLAFDQFVILSVGELNKNKNQIVLIKAVELLKNKMPNIKLLLAGNGPNELFLKSYVNKHELTNFIEFLGYRTDLEQIMPMVDLVASACKREGLGLNIIEGLLCEIPVVCSNNRGHRELIHNMVNGFIVEENNPQFFANTILAYYGSKEREPIKNNCIKSVQAYTVQNTIIEFSDLIRTLLYDKS